MFGLDIGIKTIKIAEVNKINDKFYLERYEIIDKSYAIKKGLNIKINKAVVTIPGEEIRFFTFSIENPEKYSGEAIKDLIVEKNKDFIKFQKDKANVEFQILNRYSKDGIYYSDIFAEIINIDVLNNYRKILSELKVKPVSIDSSTYRLANLIEAKNFVLFNIAEREVIIFIYFNRIPRYIRRTTKEDLKFLGNFAEPIGAKNLFRFINDTIDYYVNNDKIEKIFISGNITNYKESIEILNKFTNIPVESIINSKLIEVKCTINEENLINLVCCIGAVLGEYE